MKKIIQLIIIIASSNLSFAQSLRESGEKTMVYIMNDVKLTAAQNNTTETATGTGSLGILFRQKYMYGSVSFNVINRNDKLSTNDSSNIKIFANNLLIPENSGQGISSFFISLGWKSFYKYTNEDNWSNVSFFSMKRFGAFFFFQANNTNWTKDTVSTSIQISSPGVYVTYQLLNLQLDNEAKDKVYLSAFGGLQARLLGGDYGQVGNKKTRDYFLHLNQDKLNFIGTTFGVKMEFGKFFGKLQETYFWGKNNISGFSGWQSVVSLGANIDINIPVKNTAP